MCCYMGKECKILFSFKNAQLLKPSAGSLCIIMDQSGDSQTDFTYLVLDYEELEFLPKE